MRSIQKWFLGIATLLMLIPLAAQDARAASDPVVLSYQRNFVRASMSTKIDLLNDASRITTVNMTPLYVDAIVFIRQNYSLLGNDAQLMELALGVCSKIPAWKDSTSLPHLRALFSEIREYRVQSACLEAFAVLAQGDDPTVQFLNSWFAATLLSPEGDTRTMIACAKALGRIGDPSSFAILFTASTSKADTGVVSASKEALNGITENYGANILAIISEKRIQDTYAAFSLAMKKEGLSPQDRGAIAEAAFSVAMDYPRGQSDSDSLTLSMLIKESLGELKQLSWSKASPAVVAYFYQLQGDYRNGKATVDTLLPVITTMGSMGTGEAAQALSIFLGVLNSETEQKKTYNEQLMLAVIQSLGDLGDKTAFDYLLYVGYLEYPETVKKASRDSLARLKW